MPKVERASSFRLRPGNDSDAITKQHGHYATISAFNDAPAVSTQVLVKITVKAARAGETKDMPPAGRSLPADRHRTRVLGDDGTH